MIVCEGTKTEPLYFKGMRIAERLSSANVHVTPAHGTDPVSIVEYAERHAADYDCIFCVFDRDGHANYTAALNRIAASDGRLKAITSWPCFEVWMLLHYRYSAAEIVAAGNRSAGEMACRELQQHIPSYQKAYVAAFNDLLPLRETALANATRLQADNARTRAVNPSTRVHELVTYLLNLKR